MSNPSYRRRRWSRDPSAFQRQRHSRHCNRAWLTSQRNSEARKKPKCRPSGFSACDLDTMLVCATADVIFGGGGIPRLVCCAAYASLRILLPQPTSRNVRKTFARLSKHSSHSGRRLETANDHVNEKGVELNQLVGECCEIRRRPRAAPIRTQPSCAWVSIAPGRAARTAAMAVSGSTPSSTSGRAAIMPARPRPPRQ